MNLAQVTRWCNLAGKFGAIFCFLLLATLLDGLIGQFREPAHIIKVLPGTSVQINGELVEEVRGVQELTALSDSDHLRVSFEALHKGYFLGGDMWRGHLFVGSLIQPGEYNLNVLPKTSSSTRKTPAFRILVYPDALSLQRSAKSLIRSYLDISPFGVAAAFLPGVLLALGAVYFLAGKRETLLARLGQAEVYRVTRREGEYEIRFGLGTEHGLGPGVQIRILTETGQAVGIARVEESTPTDSMAVVTADQEVRAGYLVARR